MELGSLRRSRRFSVSGNRKILIKGRGRSAQDKLAVRAMPDVIFDILGDRRRQLAF